MDTRSGSADDHRLCSQTVMLAPAALAGPFLPVAVHSQHPPPPWLWDRMPPPPGQLVRLDSTTLHAVHYPTDFTAHFTLWAPPSCEQHLLLMSAPLSPGAVTPSRPLSLPLRTSHVTFPSRPRNTLWGAALWYVPPPLVLPVHVRGDLPLGVAPCVL